MPRKKISLEEAFAVFEKHGLQVEVKAVQQQQSIIADNPADFVVQPLPSKVDKPKRIGDTTVRITLYSKQSVSSGGSMDTTNDSATYQYGPGVCYVPEHLVQHLLYQDQLAKEYDRRLLDPTHRSYLVVPRRTAQGMVNVGIEVDDLNLGAASIKDMYFA